MSAARAMSASAVALVGLLALVASGCAATGAPEGARGAMSSESGDADVFRQFSDADRAYRESRWIDAARGYQRLTERVPDDPYAWFRLGNTYAQQGAYDRAIHAYEASLARNAEQPKPWFNLATAYLLSAQAAMTRAYRQLRPGDPARDMIARRIERLQALTHERVEELADEGIDG